MKSGVSVTKVSNVDSLSRRLAELEKCDVLVGIPQENNSRPGEEISNSELAFIMEHGSPIHNIPPRPFIGPAIRKNKEIIVNQLKRAAQAVLAGDEGKANAERQKTGILASNSVKRFMADSDNGLARNAPSTIRAKGSDIPLIDLGELRRAVSYSLQPIENLPKDKWKQAKLGQGGKFGAEADVPVPELAKRVARSTASTVEQVAKEATEAIGEAGETLGGAAELLVL